MEWPASLSLHEPLTFGAGVKIKHWRGPAGVCFHATAPLWLFVAIQYLFIDWVNEMVKIRILTPCFRTCLSTADSQTSKLWSLCSLDSETQPSELGLADSGNFILSLCREIQTRTLILSHIASISHAPVLPAFSAAFSYLKIENCLSWVSLYPEWFKDTFGH